MVFELKKKEIELARQQIQSKISAHEHQTIAQPVKNSTMDWTRTVVRMQVRVHRLRLAKGFTTDKKSKFTRFVICRSLF
jgi:predicted protein tyrosine phosphatase